MYLFVAIAVTTLVIALAWRGIGARTPGTEPSSAGFSRPQRPARPTRTIAPDDDPEFLNEINKKLRGEDKSG